MTQQNASASVIGGGSPPLVDAEPALVALSGVWKRFESVVAVADLTLTIRDGEFFALLGPSGCGKTTTLKLIGGFEEPTRGDVSIGGASVAGLPPFKRAVNTVFQNYALFPHLDVRDNVAFGLRMQAVGKAERRARAEEALERVQLGGTARRRIHQLSGGQQQRVALARALVNRPRVLLLDEPLGALDLKLRKAMQLELKALQRDVGITFIYVTHDQEEALTMADRIAVMRSGEALQVGSPDEIYERPTTRFVAAFIGESSFLSGSLERNGGPTATVILDSGEHLACTTQHASGRVAVAVRPENIELRSSDDPVEPGTNCVRGHLETLEYAGGDTFLYLRTMSGERVVVRRPSAEVWGRPEIQPGASLQATFTARAAVVVPEDDPEVDAEPAVADGGEELAVA